MKRTVLLIESRQGCDSVSYMLLREHKIPTPVLNRMKNKRNNVDRDWLYNDDIKERDYAGEADVEKARFNRCYAIFRAQVKDEEGKILDISNGIPPQYQVTMIISCITK